MKLQLPLAPGQRGPLLELDQLRRQLSLGAPIVEGAATIAVADIIAQSIARMISTTAFVR
jgi:hypothetical protein